jgi:hypothetical protein
MTERNSAIHATGGLFFDNLTVTFGVDLFPVFDTNCHRPALSCGALGNF